MNQGEPAAEPELQKKAKSPESFKNVAIATIIILFALTVFGFAFGIYEHIQNSELRKQSKQQPSPAVIPDNETIIDSGDSTTKYKDPVQAMANIIDQVWNAATKPDGVETSDQKYVPNSNNWYVSNSAIILKTKTAVAPFLTEDYQSYTIRWRDDNQTKAEQLESAIFRELTNNAGFKLVHIFYDTKTSQVVDGYLNEAQAILCSPIEHRLYMTDFDNISSSLTCYTDTSFTEEHLDYYNYNEYAEAYKQAKGKYPEYLTITNIYSADRLIDADGKWYSAEFDNDKDGYYYYEQYNDYERSDMKYVDSSMCESNSFSEIEQKLFRCVEDPLSEQSGRKYLIGIRLGSHSNQ